jgi:hypothetical protein
MPRKRQRSEDTEAIGACMHHLVAEVRLTDHERWLHAWEREKAPLSEGRKRHAAICTLSTPSRTHSLARGDEEEQDKGLLL